MKMNYKYVFNLGVLLLLESACPPAFGGAPQPPRALRLRALSWQGETEDLFIRSSPNEDFHWIHMLANDYIRSPAMDIVLDKDLIIHHRSKLESGEWTYREVGRIRPEEAGNEFLIIIMVTPDGKYAFHLMAEGPDDFPENSFRFFNGTRHLLAVSAEDSAARLPPRQQVTLAAKGNDNAVGIHIQVASIGGEDFEMVYSNRLARREGQRILLLAVESTNARRPVIVKRLMDASSPVSPSPGGR